MFTSQPVGFVISPYKDASQIPKGLGAKHEADGVLRIVPEFEAGLTDIEGFSHLIVLWEFDRSVRRPQTIARTACLPRARPVARTQLA
jgi:tRNA (Thr-GGU) A37 N-methylase